MALVLAMRQITQKDMSYLLLEDVLYQVTFVSFLSHKQDVPTSLSSAFLISFKPTFLRCLLSSMDVFHLS